jgi:hypothetical protein
LNIHTFSLNREVSPFGIPMVLVHPTASNASRLTCESQTWENQGVPNMKKSEVLIDRRIPKDRRKGGERRTESAPVTVERRKTERRKVPRRRQIDPTTCERDYSNDEIEFMHALDAYKRANGRMFPTCSEILEVIRDMGYVRLPASDACPTASVAGANSADSDSVAPQ